MLRFALIGPAAGAVLLVVQPTGAQSASRAEIDRLVTVHASPHRVPEALVHRVIRRESSYNARAASRGNLGLMQIRHGTAQGLGYRGLASGLLDAETNLRYGIAYLAGALRVAEGDHDRAVSLYARGYYDEAKRKGLTGRGMPRAVPADESPQPQIAEAPAPQADAPSWLAALFGGQSASPPVAQEPEAVPPVEQAEDGATEPSAPTKVAKPRGTTRVVRREPRGGRPVVMGSAGAD